MSQYKITKIVGSREDIIISVEVGSEIENTGFPAEVGNPNYDQFLISAKLTDKKAKALEPDVWFDFPGEAN